ncbi:MAG: hypothetical protein MUD00_00790 [Candidatus Pacebacteria bacterium]|nr:hypothetical protein [Candidatus Paceibacterota bacterium]
MRKKIRIAGLALALSLFGGQAAHAATTFNTNSQDFATVRVSNYTLHPNSSTNWNSSVNATPGQIISVAIYYHNTGTEPATNTTIRLFGGSSMGSSMYHSISGSVGASNATTASGQAQVILSNAQTLTFIPGSASWHPNQTSVGQNLPNGQSGLELFSGGLNIGTIAPGWGAQGSVVLRFQVGGSQQQTAACNDGTDNDGDGLVDMNDPGCTSTSDTDEYNSTNNNGSSPDVTTNNATGIDVDEAILRGTYDANNASTTTWFEYARDYDDVADGDGTRVGSQNQGTSSGSIQYRLTGLRENTTYYFRAVAQNSHGTDYGSIRSFKTDVEEEENTGSVTALTSLSTAVTQTSATINGVVTNSTDASATGWFEYGRTTSLGAKTPTRSLGTSSSRSMIETVTGLSSDTIYYFRAVAESDNGEISRGDILTFKTAGVQTVQVVTTPTTVVTTPTTVVTSPMTVVSTGASRFVFIKIENRFENVAVGDTIDYTVTYRNISSRTLQKAVIEVVFPKEVKFVRSSDGEYDDKRNVLVVPIGTLVPGDEGTITIDAKVLSVARSKDALLTNALFKYTNPVTTVQEEAIAYVINRVENQNGTSLGAASIFGDGSFLPTTLLGWLFLILVIFGLIVLGRMLYNKSQLGR